MAVNAGLSIIIKGCTGHGAGLSPITPLVKEGKIMSGLDNGVALGGPIGDPYHGYKQQKYHRNPIRTHLQASTKSTWLLNNLRTASHTEALNLK
jgi:hypothetical protein